MELSPKEKAKELVDRFLNMEFGIFKEYLPNHIIIAKQSALICVDEILDAVEDVYKLYDFWYEVKQEIKKL